MIYAVVALAMLSVVLGFSTWRLLQEDVSQYPPRDGRPLGTVVCNGVTFTITEVRLYGGLVMFWADVPGTVTLEGPMTVVGEDGVGLFQGGHLDERTYVSHGNGRVHLRLPLRVLTTDTEEAERR